SAGSSTLGHTAWAERASRRSYAAWYCCRVRRTWSSSRGALITAAAADRARSESGSFGTMLEEPTIDGSGATLPGNAAAVTAAAKEGGAGVTGGGAGGDADGDTAGWTPGHSILPLVGIGTPSRV